MWDLVKMPSSVNLPKVNKGLQKKEGKKPNNEHLSSVSGPRGSAAVSKEINLLDCWFSKRLGQLLDRDMSEPLPLSPVIIG